MLAGGYDLGFDPRPHGQDGELEVLQILAELQQSKQQACCFTGPVPTRAFFFFFFFFFLLFFPLCFFFYFFPIWLSVSNPFWLIPFGCGSKLKHQELDRRF